MNSEDFKIIDEFAYQPPDMAEVKVGKVETQIRELQDMPGWKLLVQDLGGIKDNLTKALLEAQTLKEVYLLQGRIKNIDLFINTPKKYISQSKTYLNRRTKWQKK
jgi:hypothetical protein